MQDDMHDYDLTDSIILNITYDSLCICHHPREPCGAKIFRCITSVLETFICQKPFFPCLPCQLVDTSIMATLKQIAKHTPQLFSLLLELQASSTFYCFRRSKFSLEHIPTSAKSSTWNRQSIITSTVRHKAIRTTLRGPHILPKARLLWWLGPTTRWIE